MPVYRIDFPVPSFWGFANFIWQLTAENAAVAREKYKKCFSDGTASRPEHRDGCSDTFGFFRECGLHGIYMSSDDFDDDSNEKRDYTPSELIDSLPLYVIFDSERIIGDVLPALFADAPW
jgi:hypothetical protein